MRCTALLDSTCTSVMSRHTCNSCSEIALACAAHVVRNMPRLPMLLWDIGLDEARSWKICLKSSPWLSEMWGLEELRMTHSARDCRGAPEVVGTKGR